MAEDVLEISVPTDDGVVPDASLTVGKPVSLAVVRDSGSIPQNYSAPASEQQTSANPAAYHPSHPLTAADTVPKAPNPLRLYGE